MERNKNPPSIQGRGFQDPGKEVTVWVALGVENKGQAGVEPWEAELRLGLEQMV